MPPLHAQESLYYRVIVFYELTPALQELFLGRLVDSFHGVRIHEPWLTEYSTVSRVMVAGRDRGCLVDKDAWELKAQDSSVKIDS